MPHYSLWPVETVKQKCFIFIPPRTETNFSDLCDKCSVLNIYNTKQNKFCSWRQNEMCIKRNYAWQYNNNNKLNDAVLKAVQWLWVWLFFTWLKNVSFLLHWLAIKSFKKMSLSLSLHQPPVCTNIYGRFARAAILFQSHTNVPLSRVLFWKLRTEVPLVIAADLLLALENCWWCCQFRRLTLPCSTWSHSKEMWQPEDRAGSYQGGSPANAHSPF